MEWNDLDVNLRHVYYFITVAESPNITRAAQKLYVSQPLLSKKIMALEEQTGVDLLYRENRGIHLTPAGQYLYREWKKMLQDFEHSVIHAGQIENLPIGHLNVGCFPVLHPSKFLAPYWTHLQEIAPRMEITVKRQNHSLILSDIQTGKLDIAFMLKYDIPSLPDVFEHWDLEKCPLVAVVPTGHRLAEKSRLSFDDLNGCALIFSRPEHSPSGTSPMDTLCRERGVTSQSVTYTNSDVTSFIRAEMGQGIAVGPKLFYLEDSPKVRLLALGDESLPISAIWHAKASESMKDLIKTWLYAIKAE